MCLEFVYESKCDPLIISTLLENFEGNKFKTVCNRNDQKVLQFKDFNNVSYRTQNAMLYISKTWKPFLSCKGFPRIFTLRPWISSIEIHGLCASKLELIAKLVCNFNFLLVLDLKEVKKAKQFYVERFVETIKQNSKEDIHLRSFTMLLESNESFSINSYSSLVKVCTEHFIYLDMLEIDFCTITLFRSVFDSKHDNLIPLRKLNLKKLRLNQNDLKNFVSNIEWCWSISELSLCCVNMNDSFEGVMKKINSFRYIQVVKLNKNIY